MIAVGRFQLDPGDERAAAHLVRSAFIPRGAREALALRAAMVLLRRGLRLSPRRLARPAPATGAAPTHEQALEALREVLGEPVSSGLSMVQAPHAAGERRLLFAWRAGDPEPFAVAKVALPGGAALLEREAAALQRVAALGEDIAAGCARLLAHGSGGGLRVLVQEAVHGIPLARMHRVALRAGSWHPSQMAAAGYWLGRFHAATLSTAGTGGASLPTSSLHGDAWSRNVIVRPAGGGGPHRLVAFVDWEAFVEAGDPLDDVVHFALESGKADLAGRSGVSEARRRSHEKLVRWLFLRGSRPFPAVRALFMTWRESLSRAFDVRFLREAAIARLVAAGGSDVLPPDLVAALLSGDSALP